MSRSRDKTSQERATLCPICNTRHWSREPHATLAGPDPKDISRCRSCRAELVFLRTKNGKRMPVNVVPTEPAFRGPNNGEVLFCYGEHQSHFQTCTNPGAHRR
jgi:hypothetical protein